MSAAGKILREIDREGVLAALSGYLDHVEDCVEASARDRVCLFGLDDRILESDPELERFSGQFWTALNEIRYLKPPFDAKTPEEILDRLESAHVDFSSRLLFVALREALPALAPGGLPALLRRLADEIERPEEEETGGDA